MPLSNQELIRAIGNQEIVGFNLSDVGLASLALRVQAIIEMTGRREEDGYQIQPYTRLIIETQEFRLNYRYAGIVMLNQFYSERGVICTCAQIEPGHNGAAFLTFDCRNRVTFHRNDAIAQLIISPVQGEVDLDLAEPYPRMNDDRPQVLNLRVELDI